MPIHARPEAGRRMRLQKRARSAAVNRLVATQSARINLRRTMDTGNLVAHERKQPVVSAAISLAHGCLTNKHWLWGSLAM